MKERNNVIMILLFFSLFYVCCEKKNNLVDINHNDNIIIIKTDEDTIFPRVINLQEQIKNYDEKMILLFQEEGNFTNSGNMELLAFYQSKSSLSYEGIKNNYISKVYCFICDELNETIQRIIEIKNYGTGSIDLKKNSNDTVMNALGREIFWLGETFGYIGDFNNNGKEELYFFETNSMGTEPRFFEFINDDFKKILIYASFTVDYEGIIGAEIINIPVLVNIESEQKILTFENNIRVKPRYVSYIWDSDENIFKEMANTEIPDKLE